MRGSVRAAFEVCPVEVATAVLGGSWKLTIVKHLGAGTLRHGELCRALPAAPPRTLTRQLRELEADGVVHREVYAEVPPKVEYSLTVLGASMAPIIVLLDEWGADYERQTGAPG